MNHEREPLNGVTDYLDELDDVIDKIRLVANRLGVEDSAQLAEINVSLWRLLERLGSS